MEKYLKHPIILAIIVGAVIYILMSYFYNPEDPEDKTSKKSKKSKKEKTGFFTDKRETTILVSAIAALGTWFLAKTYLVTDDESNVVDISGMDNTGAPVNPLVNSLLGPDAGSNEAGILNMQPSNQFAQQPMGQTMGQPMGQSMGQPMDQSMGQSMVQPMGQPMNQPAMNNPAVQQVQTAAAELANKMNQTNLAPQPNMNTQPNFNTQSSLNGQQGGGHRSYNLIGNGLDLPRSAIPKVLVDYN